MAITKGKHYSLRRRPIHVCSISVAVVMTFFVQYAVTSAPRTASALALRHPTTATRRSLCAYALSVPSLDKEQSIHTPSPLLKKPWPRPHVECHGDYRKEAFLEQHIGGPMYENQSTLPHLPIPTLNDTITKFLPTALPLAETKQEEESLMEACRLFPQEAQQLQERLLDHAKEQDSSSWLQQWWNTVGYLQVRDPVVMYVSYFFQLGSDDSLESDNDQKMVKRAAAALCTAMDFCQKVATGTLAPDTIGRKATPLCMTPYKYMFHSCRIPKLAQDSYKIYDPSLYTHAVAACRGRFYKVPLVNKDTGERQSLYALEDALNQVLEKSKTSKDATAEWGWLTTSNRNDWARARTELLQRGGTQMKEALETLESSALLVCLDHEAHPTDTQEGAEHFWYGSAFNRWFDKSMQIVCTKNGKVGYIGEHSMMDGMPAINLCQHLVGTSYQEHAAKTSRGEEVANEKVEDIFQKVWSTLEKNDRKHIQDLVGTAKMDFETLSSSHEICVQDFQEYGSNFMKRAGFSPDAFVQMAIQLATYRLFGKQVATYESAQVRPFLHGRTETARAVSTSSEVFIKHMGLASHPKYEDDNARQEKLSLLKTAARRHQRYCRDASRGMGVDRHLFGLSMMARGDESAPTLFSHPLFLRSKRWRVTSSTVAFPVGFGEVVEDGVGIGYLINPDSCHFTVTCRHEHNWSEKLCHLLEDALVEMHALVDPETLPN